MSKSLSLKEAFQYPITSIPLSIANPDGHLRQSDKAAFRNYLIEEAGAMSKEVPKKSSWFIDGMAAVRTMKSKIKYEEWIESLLRFITPPDLAEAVFLAMVNDTYHKLSAKSGTRKSTRRRLSADFRGRYWAKHAKRHAVARILAEWS